MNIINVRVFTMITLSNKWNNLLQLVGVSILFIVVLAITYLTTKFVGGFKLQKEKHSNFKVIETYKIANNKFLQLIHCGDKYIVISIGKDNIQFITEVTPESVIHSEQSVLPKYDFSEILNSFKIKQKENKDQESDK